MGLLRQAISANREYRKQPNRFLTLGEIAMKLNGRSEQVLEQLLKAFESGDVADAIAHTVIEMPEGLDRPMDRWSFSNQIITILSDTSDARGYRQWKKVKRHVKNGSSAIYILVPLIAKKKDKGTGEEDSFLYGFKSSPVFRFEDTEGEPLPEMPDLEPTQPPKLLDVAEAWGVGVSYTPFAGRSYGEYHLKSKNIRLATHDESTFFHELAHAADHRVQGELKGGQRWDQEIVAELTSAVLGKMFGVDTESRSAEGRSYGYIRDYAERAGKNAHTASLSVLKRVKACLDIILETATDTERKQAA